MRAQLLAESRQPVVSDTGAIMRVVRPFKKLAHSNPDSALKILPHTLRYSRRINYDYGAGLSLLYIGNAWIAKGNYDESLKAFHRSLFYLPKSEEGRRKLSRAVNNIGLVYQDKGDYHRALTYLYAALEIETALYPSENPAMFYLNITGSMLELREPLENILHYLNKAEAYCFRFNDTANLAKVYINKGYAYNNARNWDSCLYYFQLAYQITGRHSMKQDEALSLSNIAHTYVDKNDAANALPYLIKAQALEKYLTPHQKSDLDRSLGRAYTHTKQYELAEKHLLQALEGAGQRGEPYTRVRIHRHLSDLYGITHRYKLAFKNVNTFIALNDSVQSQELKLQTRQLEAQYRTAQKDKELAERKLFIANQQQQLAAKNRWITGSLVSTALAVVLLLILRGYYRQKQRLQDQSIFQLRQQQEIDLLKARVEGEEKEKNRIARDLHDGVNGLISALSLNLQLLKKENGILTDSDVYQNTQRILGDMSSEIKKTAYNLTPHVLLQHNLPDAVLLFCEQMRKGKNIGIDVQTYGAFDIIPYEQRLTVYRIVQELLHNAIRHSGASYILVQMILQERLLTVTVEDNGIGYEPATIHKGMGLRNIEERVHSLSGHISVESAASFGTTTTVELEIDV